MEHYRESDINRFVTIGATALVVLGLGLWGLRVYAQQGLKRDALESPWVIAARAEQGPWRAVERTLTPAEEDVQQQIARWRRENADAR
ncbi:MAG TPA: hypothetical protein VHL98_01945 [Microvirga sp.]|jgi:hypothetical protein|nr:hypothetical protein [Microvirga sp.]